MEHIDCIPSFIPWNDTAPRFMPLRAGALLSYARCWGNARNFAPSSASGRSDVFSGTRVSLNNGVVGRICSLSPGTVK